MNILALNLFLTLKIRFYTWVYSVTIFLCGEIFQAIVKKSKDNTYSLLFFSSIFNYESHLVDDHVDLHLLPLKGMSLPMEPTQGLALVGAQAFLEGIYNLCSIILRVRI